MKKLNGDSSHHVQQSPCAVGAGLLHIIDFSAVADAQSGRVGDGRFFYFSALEFALSTPRGQATGQRPASDRPAQSAFFACDINCAILLISRKRFATLEIARR